MSRYKTITHLLALALGVAIAFAFSPAGKAIVAQYPILAPFVAILTALGAIYHNPIAPH